MTEAEFPWLTDYPPKPDWHMEIKPGLMTDVFDDLVKRKPNSQAFDFMGKTYSWAEIGDAVNRFAAGLQKMGVKKDQKVGLFLPNCPLFLIAYYGVLKIGGTVVNFNPLYVKAELAHQIEDSDTEIMVTLDLAMLYDKMEEALSDTRLEKLIIGKFADMLGFPKNLLFPIVKSKDVAKVDKSNSRITMLDDLMNNDGQYQPAQLDPLEDVAVLQYTGGTTGTPKGAMLTHMNIYANAVQCYSNFPDPDPNINNGHEKMMAVLPFFHVFSMTVCMNMSVLAGMEIVTIPRFDLKEALKTITKKEPQYMPAVPAIFNAINNCADLKKYNLKSLNFCISGGAPLPVEVKKKFEAKTGSTVVEGYGLTESSPVSNVNPPFGENIAGSIGLPIPQTIIEIIDREDKETHMPLGERGEVCIRGPQVMKGYYKKPEETDKVLKQMPDGTKRLYTGDIAYMDKRGYTYIVDRIKDLIITNGYNVYPRHVEEAIYKHPNVEECIVAGLPDAQRGEIVKAWVKLKEGRELTEAELRDFLSDEISKIQMPRKIEFRAEPLPKTMIGKLSRKDIVAEELGEKKKEA